MPHRGLRGLRAIAAVLILTAAHQGAAFDLQGTRWEATAGRRGLDPLLLYAIALLESGRPDGAGLVSPWPWTIATSESRQHYGSRGTAVTALRALSGRTQDLAVGLLQVNLVHAPTQVGDPATLLDPAVNLAVGAEHLREVIDTAPGDLALGIGRFRHPDGGRAARAYGEQVLRLQAALRRLQALTPARDVRDQWRIGAVLDLVAVPESGGNYNAWYGAADQAAVDLAGLTVGEVRALQGQLVRRAGGSAIGRYQLLDDTLDGLIARTGLGAGARFTPALQDRLALALARDAGLDAWLAGALDDAGFAHKLARVWAGLPRDRSNRSFYAGIGHNRASLPWQTVIEGLRAIRSADLGDPTDATATP